MGELARQRLRRVYQYIVYRLQSGGAPLRLMVQEFPKWLDAGLFFGWEGSWEDINSKASAGTGKSFLLTSVYLWCLLHKFKCKAAAPTGIAAANVEVTGTDVCATTIHSLFDFDGEKYKSKLDFAKKSPKVLDLLCLDRTATSPSQGTRNPHHVHACASPRLLVKTRFHIH